MVYSKIRMLQTLLLATLLLGSCADSTENKKEANKAKPVAEKADPNDWKTNKGVGPIQEVNLAVEIDNDLSEKGKTVFELKCSACHKVNKRYIGPSPQNILERRTPEWVMNMILNPEGMVAEDPIAKQLLVEYNGTPMANQNLTEEEARAILEYFRTL